MHILDHGPQLQLIDDLFELHCQVVALYRKEAGRLPLLIAARHSTLRARVNAVKNADKALRKRLEQEVAALTAAGMRHWATASLPVTQTWRTLKPQVNQKWDNAPKISKKHAAPVYALPPAKPKPPVKPWGWCLVNDADPQQRRYLAFRTNGLPYLTRHIKQRHVFLNLSQLQQARGKAIAHINKDLQPAKNYERF